MNQTLSTLLRSSSESGTGRGISSGAAVPRARTIRDWQSRAAPLLPWALFLGMAGLLVILLGHRLVPARELAVATVVTFRQDAEISPATDPAAAGSGSIGTSAAVSGVDIYESSMLFQASGWVEPDPYPVLATALVDGVIRTVEALEGEKVARGQLLATLIDEDARLDLATAESRRDALRAQAMAHGQQVAAAEADIASLEKQVAAAEARRDEAGDLARRVQQAPKGSVSEREVAKAGHDLATRQAEVEALAENRAGLQAKVAQLKETGREIEAQIAGAETEVARRQLALDRTRIESPIDGRVLRLLAAPGQKKMLGMDDPESATVAILYDPARLQARIDVPLAEAARLDEGQPVRLRSELLPDRVFRGRVSRILGEADLQRNTLQVKVAIENPDDRLRPDMLCRAEFLAPAAPDSIEGEDSLTHRERSLGDGNRVRVFAPVAALAGDVSRESGRPVLVWKADATGERVVPQPVTLGPETREDHRLVLEGLKPGDRVVLNPPPDLQSGDRFRPAASFTPN